MSPDPRDGLSQTCSRTRRNHATQLGRTIADAHFIDSGSESKKWWH